MRGGQVQLLLRHNLAMVFQLRKIELVSGFSFKIENLINKMQIL